MYKSIYVYMVTNHIIAIQYTIEGLLLCNYPLKGQDHAHVNFVCTVM